MNEKLNIGIIIGSTRENRVSPQVASWIKSYADQRADAHYQILDIKDYKLPLFLILTKKLEPFSVLVSF
jgi:NAD(P)H-dependent FMN reductase